MPSKNSWLKDNGYYMDEEAEVYNATLQDVYDNPRWYLDNLEFLREYRVSWSCYTRKVKKGRSAITLPLGFINKTSPTYNGME